MILTCLRPEGAFLLFFRREKTLLFFSSMMWSSDSDYGGSCLKLTSF